MPKPTMVVAVSVRLPSSAPVITTAGTTRSGGQPGRDEDLGQGDPPARDRLGQEVDGGPVVDLGAERGRPEDERDERQDGPDDERVEDAGRRPDGRR